jgi:hypothetical protein
LHAFKIEILRHFADKNARQIIFRMKLEILATLKKCEGEIEFHLRSLKKNRFASRLPASYEYNEKMSKKFSMKISA